MPTPARPGPSGRRPIRNVALVGPSGSGKSTLVDALLRHTGSSAVGDPNDRPTGALSLVAIRQAGVTVHLLDTPGHADFVGEVVAGLRAADGVVFVVSAVAGLDPVNAQLWQQCSAAGLARVVVVTHLDSHRADFDETVALCQRVLDEDVLALNLPMHDDGGSVAGLLTLLDARVVDHSTGRRVERTADPEHLALVDALRTDLIEALVGGSEDETLLDRYLDGKQPEPQQLAEALAAGVASGQLWPVLATAPLAGVGLAELLDLLVDAFPAPAERACPPVSRPDGAPALPLACDPAGPLVAEVVRTAADAEGRRLSFVRVFSGTLRPEITVTARGHRVDGPAQRASEVVGPLAAPQGSSLHPVDSCSAGDLCAVAGLDSAGTGDTLSAVDDPLLLAAWSLPEPQLPIAVEAASPLDREQLSAALRRLVCEDPVARLEWREATRQQVLWCTGPLHAEVLLDRLRSRDGTEVRTPDVEVPLRQVASGLLEPWCAVSIFVPTAFARSVLSDLSGRRARRATRESDPEDDEQSVVRVELPEVELLGYAAALRVVSHGTGSFSRRAIGDEPR
ncbi:MAG: GTP-binding protein [Actinobacteria bacterium]|nr:GTP-binding protein [Actinomycetota bacterium]